MEGVSARTFGKAFKLADGVSTWDETATDH